MMVNQRLEKMMMRRLVVNYVSKDWERIDIASASSPHRPNRKQKTSTSPSSLFINITEFEELYRVVSSLSPLGISE